MSQATLEKSHSASQAFSDDGTPFVGGSPRTTTDAAKSFVESRVDDAFYAVGNALAAHPNPDAADWYVSHSAVYAARTAITNFPEARTPVQAALVDELAGFVTVIHSQAFADTVGGPGEV